MADYRDLMLTFRRGFARADREMLASVLAPEFEWHTHTFDPDDPAPTGRILVGLDGLMDQIAWRQEHWTDVRFDGMVEHYAPGMVTQSFTISGVDRGRPFEVRAVDIYPISDADLILRKDTYWKQPGV